MAVVNKPTATHERSFFTQISLSRNRFFRVSGPGTAILLIATAGLRKSGSNPTVAAEMQMDVGAETVLDAVPFRLQL